ncbi:AMP-binding enzyme [Nocardioides terrae]|uniref:AMP-binding enzyme n=1 Tax=Nocardioides terrae TaxID=574651 RepID=A0A1I1IW81_9ACTN|nr:AMP-binding protein [Nocardioides terrae]SFC40589.1 AMP-binding enzyme [Nocardioides terrae]
MSLARSLDLGASLVPTAPCLVTDATTLSYAETQGLSRSVEASLRAYQVGAEDTVGLLSANDPSALTCIFGASRAGAAWTMIDPVEASVAELAEELADCSVLIFRTAEAECVRQLQPLLPRLRTMVCLDGHADGALGWGQFLTAGFTGATAMPPGPPPAADGLLAADQAVFLALRPLSPETAARWEPVLARGGRIVVGRREQASAVSALRVRQG